MIRLYIGAGLLAVLVAAGGWLYWSGISAERERAALEAAEQYRATRERIDNAISDPRTPDDIRERLRRLAQ